MNSPSAAAGDALEVERLQRALRCLTPCQQQVLVLRPGQGLTAREAGCVLQKTTGSVKATQHRAIASLRRMLAVESPA